MAKINLRPWREELRAEKQKQFVVVVQVLKDPNTYKLEIRVSHMKIHTYEIQLQSSAREGGKN